MAASTRPPPPRNWWKLQASRAVVARIADAYRFASLRKPIRPGTTVVTVNSNSLAQLEVLLSALARYTPSPVDILVVDNGSSDGSEAFLRAHPTVRSLFLPFNVGHGVALDIGVLAANTSHVVVFDVDAFPISERWIGTLLDPLDEGCVISGAHVHRAYIHPCFLALRRSDFVEYRLSFLPVGHQATRREPAPLFMDTGEALSHRLSMIYGTCAIHPIPATSIRGPGMIGSVFGDAAYHNFYSTHGQDTEWAKAARDAWAEAVDRYVRSGP